MLAALEDTLVELFGSKKFLILLGSMATWLVAHFGWHVDQGTIDRFLAVVSAALVAQGVADHGKPAAEAHATANVEIAKINAATAVAVNDNQQKAGGTVVNVSSSPPAAAA